MNPAESLARKATTSPISRGRPSRPSGMLAAIASRIAVGATFTGSPSDVGREVGIDDPLAVARAMRALLSRGRLQVGDGGYVLSAAITAPMNSPGSLPE